MAKRFKDGEIVKILKEAESIGNVRGVIRKYNVSEQSFYRWRQKYGGIQIRAGQIFQQLKRGSIIH